jgi:ParB-like nuclease domain
VKTTTPSPSSSATTFTELDAAVISKNPWNPNRMTAAMFAKALESISLYGFIDPLTVRHLGENLYQIIDGEHRYDAGIALGMDRFPCTVIEGLSDAQAKKLTIVLNELHGQADPGKMGDLLADILALTSLDDLLVALPYDEPVLAGFLQSVMPTTPLEPLARSESESKEPWAERLFKMPKTVALIVDEAIEKAKDGEEIETWRALERVAADFLAS